MSNQNAELIRRAYLAYAEGNLDPMLELVDPDVEWTCWILPSSTRPTDLPRPPGRAPPARTGLPHHYLTSGRLRRPCLGSLPDPKPGCAGG